MMRTPLRPLARVLDAREKGENPDVIEAEERAIRNVKVQMKMRRRAESRLLVLGVFFFAAFLVVGARMATLAATEPREPVSTASIPQIANQRADIIDRNGEVLATNLATTALYAQPPLMVDPAAAAEGLAQIFPDLDLEKLRKDFSGKRKFLWIKKKISPEQQQLVHDLGEPGLLFGPREMRLYPNGKLAAHILGGASFGKEGVNAAEVIGIAGVERYFDESLRDPAREGEPLQLSIDMTAQSAMRDVLAGGVKLMSAKGAGAILMDIHTGEILSMASLPDFDPNNRPQVLTQGDQSDSPLFNRASQGVYELGSTFKIFQAGINLDLGLVNENTMVDTKGPLKWGKFKIRDFHDYGKQLSVTDVMVKSSNIGTARMALAAGAGAQQEMLEKLGFFEAVPVELGEARKTKPLLPKRWSEISTMTISYGHGIAATPLHLATAYATMGNGGYKVKPTLIKQDGVQADREQIISKGTSEKLVKMLRAVVTRGTASFGEVKGYEVAGKTGSADKPKPSGGYYEDKVISTFASVFPASDPKYVLVVTLDEPSIMAHGEERRTAGWTAVPVSAEIIARLMPILGLRPNVASAGNVQYTAARN
ncbi:penicillin-binding protein 2 [Amylibacter sp. IMCC11727]|uniref:peptidoglycan D,D-transpeptidase FtsI family protein n=1 Tax=Amylibacter sp. IMCC11727 TaxID=3039851 RepID=UPI00244DDE7E|nr:penicillin-binding protein 2 [Amylibacter sp. IMCC11727]WGI23512.1 penicillin-binding protein 2 [Amylibacter sp. IMCC11727]